jgi:hypothetical protein
MPGERAQLRPGPTRGASGSGPTRVLPGAGAARPWADDPLVRPFFLTRGRTRSDLPVEAMVHTVPSPGRRLDARRLPPEYRAILQLCATPRAVAEVAGRLGLPLGVARVLVGDLTRAGVVAVGGGRGEPGTTVDLALIDRLIAGVGRL